MEKSHFQWTNFWGAGQVQGILGHSRIQTTLDLYTDEDLDGMIAAQDKFIDAVGFERETVQ